MSISLTLVSAVALAPAALVQTPVVIYAPVRSVADQQISLWSWGSGVISQTDEMTYEGVYSLRVSTKNYFQGGGFDMGKPVDLSKEFADKFNLVRVILRVPDQSTVMGGGGGAGSIGGGGVNQAGGGSRGGSGLAGGEAGAAGGPPASGGQSSAADTTLKNVRMIVTTTDGLRSEVYVPITTSGAGERGWRFVAIPLQAIKGFDRTNKTVKAVSFSGDAIATFYLGDIRIINDSTPIHGEPNYRDLNLALGDEIEFRANGFAGSSVLVYRWDFDDKDGVQIDAEGQIVKRKFRKQGTFVITLTIADAFGLKDPYSTKINVTVNP